MTNSFSFKDDLCNHALQFSSLPLYFSSFPICSNHGSQQLQTTRCGMGRADIASCDVFKIEKGFNFPDIVNEG